jgi:hypothetical protein
MSAWRRDTERSGVRSRATVSVGLDRPTTAGNWLVSMMRVSARKVHLMRRLGGSVRISTRDGHTVHGGTCREES